MKQDIPLNCPICQSPMRHIPAGISKKSGKPYSEFWACISRECDYTWRGNEPRKQVSAIKEADQGDKILEAILKHQELTKLGMGLIRGDIKKLSEQLDKKDVIIYPDTKKWGEGTTDGSELIPKATD